MTTLKATFDPLVGTLTTNNMHFSSMTSYFFDNACTKLQNMAFKTSKMYKISLEY